MFKAVSNNNNDNNNNKSNNNNNNNNNKEPPKPSLPPDFGRLCLDCRRKYLISRLRLICVTVHRPLTWYAGLN